MTAEERLLDHIAALLLGLGNGGVYAALALALVLTYRSSGVINFATGAIALHGAYMYASLRHGELLILVPGLPKTMGLGGELGFAPALIGAVLINAILGALLYLAVFRPLREAPPLARAVASLGVLVVIQELISIRQGPSPINVEPFFPTDRWDIGQIVILADRMYLAITVIALAVVIAAIFRYTRFGLHTRAAADSQTGAYVSGVSPDRVALYNWMIGGAVAAMAGILIAPITPLTPVTYSLFVIPALAAALVGGFKNLVPTVVAGVAIGMLHAEASIQAVNHSWMPRAGAPETVTLLVVLGALIITGKAIPERGGLIRLPLGHAPRPRALLLPTVAGSAIGLLALTFTEGTWRAAVIATFIGGIIGLSLIVVTGYAGQVSVAQLALAGVGGFSLSTLTTDWHVPFPIAPLLAATFAMLVGVLVGLPALRLRGLTLGIVTLTFAYAIEAVWFRNNQFVGSGGRSVEQPSLFGIDLSIGVGLDFPRFEFGLVCLIFFVAVAFGVAKLRTSALGSAMLAVRANERSASGLGVDVVRVKLTAFAISSFIAGLGGALLSYRRGVITFESFSTLGNLSLLSTGYLAGVTSVWGGVLAGIIGSSGVMFVATDKLVDLGRWFPLVSSILLVLTLISHPEGLASGGQSVARRLRLRRVKPTPAPASAAPRASADTGAVVVPIPSRATESGGSPNALEITGLSVRYGGVVAVSQVDLVIPRGSIVGLIGPNGAGKTSLIDAVTGFARADGTIMVNGRSITGEPPHERVALGLARTFQAIELYDDLSVEENVSVAALGLRSAERSAAVIRSLELVGIVHLLERPAGELSQGERQLVSIARACAAEPDVLLLDEPAAGLDTTESEWLGERIREIAAGGTSILLVDHDVQLVLRVCDDLYVLDFGQLIAHGDPAAVRSDPAVAEAYLGAVHSTAAEAV